MLHTVNKSPYQSDALTTCFGLAQPGSAVLLIEDGIYGECEACGEAIDLKRIRARPVAELCIDCKSEQEQLERREG